MLLGVILREPGGVPFAEGVDALERSIVGAAMIADGDARLGSHQAGPGELETHLDVGGLR